MGWSVSLSKRFDNGLEINLIFIRLQLSVNQWSIAGSPPPGSSLIPIIRLANAPTVKP